MKGGILQRLSEELAEYLGPTVIKPRNREDSPDMSKRDNSRTHDAPVDLEAIQKEQPEQMAMLRDLKINWRKWNAQETRPEWENNSLGFIEAVHHC